MRLLENDVLWRLFGPSGEELTGGRESIMSFHDCTFQHITGVSHREWNVNVWERSEMHTGFR